MIYRCRPVDITGPVASLSAEWAEARAACDAQGMDPSWVRTASDVTAVRNGCWYDPARADLAVRFVPLFCHHSKGEHAGQPFQLAPWQEDDIWRPLFGWRRPDGSRRFRTAYIEIPRKNGKTTLLAAAAPLLVVGDGEPGADVVCVASNEEQAFELFQETCRMVEASPDLSELLTVMKKRILCRKTNSMFRILTSKAGTKHGMNLHGVLADEFHAWLNDELWNVLATSSGARRQPLRFIITTAGFDRESVCYTMHSYARGCIYGGPEARDDTFFGYIAAADESDDWRKLETWIKANPGLGLDEWIEPAPPGEEAGVRPVRLSAACPWRYDPAAAGNYHTQLQNWLRERPGVGDPRKLDDLASEMHAAANSPALQNSRRRLYLNQWTAQEERWLDMSRWDACDGDVSDAELVGRPCYLAYDLAARCDLTALVALFPPEDWIDVGVERAVAPAKRKRRKRQGVSMAAENEEDRAATYPDPTRVEGEWMVRAWFWMPGEGLEERGQADHVRYDVWAEQGVMRLCSGPTIDQGDVLEQIGQCFAKHDVVAVGGDPWNGAQVVRELHERGVEVAEIPQTFKYLNAGTKELMALVLSERLRHGGHPVLRWCADHVVVSQDAAGNLRPDKKKSLQKIDGVVALVMATGMALEFVGLWERKKRRRRAEEARVLLGNAKEVIDGKGTDD